MKDAECAERKEKLNFRFLVLAIWSILCSKLFNFLKNLITKSTITEKLKIACIVKLFFFWGWGGGGEGFLHVVNVEITKDYKDYAENEKKQDYM